mgnify:CR=1 FL=1
MVPRSAAIRLGPPLGLRIGLRAPGAVHDGDGELAARIAARFGQGRAASDVQFDFVTAAGVVRSLAVAPFKPEDIAPKWYV